MQIFRRTPVSRICGLISYGMSKSARCRAQPFTASCFESTREAIGTLSLQSMLIYGTSKLPSCSDTLLPLHRTSQSRGALRMSFGVPYPRTSLARSTPEHGRSRVLPSSDTIDLGSTRKDATTSNPKASSPSRISKPAYARTSLCHATSDQGAIEGNFRKSSL